MATGLYDNGRNAFALAQINWQTDTIKVVLLNLTNYTVNFAAHQYMNLDTVPANARVAEAALTPLAPTAGICDANDVSFPSVSGAVSGAVLIYKDGGGGGNSQSGTLDRLIAYIDNLTNLPVTPNGGNINITWDDTANKIFKL